MISYFQKIGLMLLIPCLLVACSSTKQAPMPERSVEDLYNEAMDKAEKNELKEAVTLFDEVERQHPYSPWAAKAQIMAAYLNYHNAKYDDAVLALDRFLQLHPGNQYAPYAYYLKGMSYYEQISDVARDQKMTQMAMETFGRLVILYPNTDYAKDAKGKIILTQNHLAGKEMDIGRYYLKQKRYAAALNRFGDVVRHYQTSMHTQEALFRMTEAYLALGLKQDAKRAAVVLGYNYPNSTWYQKAYKLLKKNGVS